MLSYFQIKVKLGSYQEDAFPCGFLIFRQRHSKSYRQASVVQTGGHDLKSTPGVGKGSFADRRSSLTSAPLR